MHGWVLVGGGEEDVDEDVPVALAVVAVPLSDVVELAAPPTSRVTESEEIDLEPDVLEEFAAAKALDAAAMVPVPKGLDAAVMVDEYLM